MRTALSAMNSAASDSLLQSNADTTPWQEPEDFILERLDECDVLLLGTKHNRPCTFDFIIEMLPALAQCGLTHIGLEIGSDQQNRIDRFEAEGRGLGSIDVFHVIDCPEYRLLLEGVAQSDLKAVALDLPPFMWKEACTRDEWMANRIGWVFDGCPDAKMLVIVGNLHTLKEVRWRDPGKTHAFLPGQLCTRRPDLDVVSVPAECLEEEEHACDLFRMVLEGGQPVAVETDGLHARLSTLQLLAAEPMSPHEVADAVIVHPPTDSVPQQ